MNRPPTTPAEVLREEFLVPFAAEILAIPSGVVDGSEKVTEEIASLLAQALGNTPEFWMNLQAACDQYEAPDNLIGTFRRLGDAGPTYRVDAVKEEKPDGDIIMTVSFPEDGQVMSRSHALILKDPEEEPQKIRALSARAEGPLLVVELSDGRTLGLPFEDASPRLAAASFSQRADMRLIGDGHGIHWDLINEDLSVEGLVRNHNYMNDMTHEEMATALGISVEMVDALSFDEVRARLRAKIGDVPLSDESRRLLREGTEDLRAGRHSPLTEVCYECGATLKREPYTDTLHVGRYEVKDRSRSQLVCVNGHSMIEAKEIRAAEDRVCALVLLSDCELGPEERKFIRHVIGIGKNDLEGVEIVRTKETE